MYNIVNLPKNYLKYSSILITTITLLLWIDFLFNLNSYTPLWVKIYLCAVFSGLCVTTFLSFIDKTNKSVKYIEGLFSIPLLPLIGLGYISTTKKIAAFVMPLTVLVILVPLITFLTDFLNILNLSNGFKNNAIPYINLTLILIAFSYSEPFVFKFLLSLNPKKLMKEASIDSILWVSEQYNFVKISFWFLAVLTTVTTLERLSNTSILNILGTYKNIVIESLVTLVAMDRAISKTFVFSKYTTGNKYSKQNKK